MKNPKLVKDSIYWVGALDYDLRVFDIIMYTEYGTTYNAYIVKGSEKTALFETVKDKFYEDFLERVNQVTTLDQIDYLVVNHTEPDHAGSVGKIIAANPEIIVVGTSQAIRFLKEIVNGPFKHRVVNEGDILDLGDKKVKFIMAPFLHWPDTMYSLVEESKTLITCDSFGCHYCDDRLFNDAIEGDFIDAYKYYFDMIMGPFKKNVISALDKIKSLDFDTICPGHGPILRKDIGQYIELYRNWSEVTVEEKISVVVAYVSAYGYTKKLAEKITEGIQAIGHVDVYLFDLVEANIDDVMEAVDKAKGILIGSPTILSDALPPIWKLLSSINPVIHKGKVGGAFGSYGWSGEAVSNIEQRLKQLRIKVPVESLKIVFNPSDDQLNEAYLFGEKFANEL